MESDYLTKALQGKSFHTHRKTLMGLDGINEHMFYEKFKNNNKSSTKAELVGVDDAMTFVMWMKHSFESQL